MKKLAPMLLVLTLFFANVSFVSAQEVFGEVQGVTSEAGENQNFSEQIRDKRSVSFWVRVAGQVILDTATDLVFPPTAHSI